MLGGINYIINFRKKILINFFNQLIGKNIIIMIQYLRVHDIIKAARYVVIWVLIDTFINKSIKLSTIF